MVVMVEVRVMSPADSEGFARWYAALASGASDGRVAASVSSLQELTDSLASPSPVKRRLAVAAFEGAECVGAMLFEMPLTSDRGTVMVEIAVPPARRGRGVGAALWEWAERRANHEGRSIFQTEVSVPTGHTTQTWPGARFARARGFVSANVEDHLLADLPFDPARLAVLEAGHGAGDGYRIEAWSGPCPDRHVEAWADLHTAMSVDVPTGELAREAVVHSVERVRTSEQRMAKTWIALSSLALTVQGEAAGFSTLLLPRTRPEHAHQDDTLVLRAHRGHNLGSRLKTANLRTLERLPVSERASRRWLHTYTAQDNTPMQVVNARFGFRRVEVMHEYEKRTDASVVR